MSGDLWPLLTRTSLSIRWCHTRSRLETPCG
ncbi:rCG46681, partial [Rattus norvegicus]